MPKISPKYQKDFKNSDYKNPRLLKDKERRKKRITKCILFMAISLLFFAIYGLFMSNYFSINEVQVNGLEKIKPGNVNKIIDQYRQDKFFLIFKRNNYWLFDKNDLKEKIFQYYYFEDFNIKKHWPNKVVIDLTEKDCAITWVSSNICHHLDRTGTVIEYCNQADGSIQINDLTGTPMKIGEKAVSTEELRRILELFNGVENITKNKLKISNVTKKNKNLTFFTGQGMELKFNLNLTVAEQVARLHTILKQEQVKKYLNDLSYIDLRFGEKVYFQ